MGSPARRRRPPRRDLPGYPPMYARQCLLPAACDTEHDAGYIVRMVQDAPGHWLQAGHA